MSAGLANGHTPAKTVSVPVVGGTVVAGTVVVLVVDGAGVAVGGLDVHAVPPRTRARATVTNVVRLIPLTLPHSSIDQARLADGCRGRVTGR